MNIQQANTPRLFAAGLSHDVNEEALSKHFERIDKTLKIRSIIILRDYKTFKSKGCAIVEFVDNEDCMKHLIQQFRRKSIQACQLLRFNGK